MAIEPLDTCDLWMRDVCSRLRAAGWWVASCLGEVALSMRASTTA